MAPEAVEAEEAVQRELVLSELSAEQQRLDDLAFELLTAATPLCDPADRAGFREGDRLITVAGSLVPVGEDGVGSVRNLLDAAAEQPITVEVLRESAAHDFTMRPVEVCAFHPVVIVEGDIDAFADGGRMIFPWAMMRFANDDELRGVLAHEIAHNAMGHIDARQSNMIAAGIFGPSSTWSRRARA